MKRTRTGLAGICLLLICAMAFNVTGCSKMVQAREMDLMEGITPREIRPLTEFPTQNPKAADFAIRLFKASEERGKNTLISPLSVLCALAMTANGAKGETLEQMESVLGMTVEELNLYLYSYMKNLPQDEKNKLNLANSIWFSEDVNFSVDQNFLQTNADYYGADIYKAPFNNKTCKNINNWVKQKTNEMIPEILDEIPSDAVMYLVNALAFEAEWTECYQEHQVREGEFTKEDGTKQNVQFMYGKEENYLENEKATGFIKYYKGGKYAFVAILPKAGVSVSDYVASLDGKALSDFLANPQQTAVHTAIPKFETEYDVEMGRILSGMGMPKAFQSDKAEFQGLGTSTDGNIYISRVLHKTFISVGEKGTKAGAATVVEMKNASAEYEPNKPKEVYLDRPFVYMLVDCENNIPFFIGTMMEVN